MRLLLVLAFTLLLAACNPRGAGNHENVGSNDEAIKEYADADYDLSVAWPVYFSTLVDGKEDAEGLAKALAEKGYEVEYGPQPGGIWWVVGAKEFVPTLGAIDANETAFVAVSDRFDGYYEGWELGEAEEVDESEDVAEAGSE